MPMAAVVPLIDTDAPKASLPEPKVSATFCTDAQLPLAWHQAGAVQAPATARQSPQQALLPQGTNPVLHANPHDAPSQVAVALAGAAGHGEQDAPHAWVEVLETHWPLQTWLPEAHVAATQVVPEHENVCAFGHGAHTPLQSWYPMSQEIPHWAPLQVAVPFGSDGQTAQVDPQAETLLSAAQAPAQIRKPEAQAVATQVAPEQPKVVALAVGQAAQAPAQSWYPPSHVSLHAAPSQLAVPCAEVGHGVQEAGPQEAGLVFARHWPSHRWLANAHAVATQAVPEQATPVAVPTAHAAQAPPQARKPVLHVSPHDRPSQVAAPFADVGHGAHDDGPQLASAMFETQAPPQRW
jgi:hypothetical protein